VKKSDINVQGKKNTLRSRKMKKWIEKADESFSFPFANNYLPQNLSFDNEKKD
jgi:hypothetical protein